MSEDEGAEKKDALGQRYSASADRARASEIERIKQLTPRERMLLALRLGHRRLLVPLVVKADR